MKREWTPMIVTAAVVAVVAALLPPLTGDDMDLTAGAWATLMVMLSTPLTVLLTALVAGSLRRWFLMTRTNREAPVGSIAADFGAGAVHGLIAAAAGFVAGGLVSQVVSGSWGGQLNPGTLMAYGMIAIIVALGQGAGYLVGGMSARRLMRTADPSRAPRT